MKEVLQHLQIIRKIYIQKKKSQKGAHNLPNKYELITTLYRETLNEVSNPAEWQKFLRTAGYNFRLDFDD